MVDTEQLKELVGRKAVDYIDSGMMVGLGTGSTAFYFIDELAHRVRTGVLSDISCVATSKRSATLARDRNLKVFEMDKVDAIDVTVDGADEVTIAFNGIKGGGGALLHEKIVANASHQNIWIVTEDKLVEQLGAFPLPVEIVQFGSWHLFRFFEQAGLNPRFRKAGEDSLFITDSGNYIIDLHLEKIHEPYSLQKSLDSQVGVVEHGLFIQVPDVILIAQQDGTIKVLEK